MYKTFRVENSVDVNRHWLWYQLDTETSRMSEQSLNFLVRFIRKARNVNKGEPIVMKSTFSGWKNSTSEANAFKR